MGQTLSRAKKGTSANDSSDGKLEFNSVNDIIIERILGFVVGYSAKHPEEGKLAFKQPLCWVTSLRPDDFPGGDYENRGDEVVSKIATDEGTPASQLSKSGNKYLISACTMLELENLVRIAGDRKINEARSCLEATTDPMTRIVGDRFATVDGEDMSAYRYMEEILRGPRKGEDESELVAKKVTLRLVLDLQRLDTELLKMFVDRFASSIRLSMDAIESQVKLIKEFCGEDEEKFMLEDIGFTTEQSLTNGCRAPSWRQIHGDLAYVEVKPHDVENFWVTANAEGFFENKGWLKGRKELGYEKVGVVHRNLVALVKSKSPRFAELIDKQSWDALSRTKNKKPGNGKKR